MDQLVLADTCYISVIRNDRRPRLTQEFIETQEWLQMLCICVYCKQNFCPQSNPIRSDPSLTRNGPNLTYSDLRFQNFPREKPPDPIKKGKKD